jgi:hypothetical protein
MSENLKTVTHLADYMAATGNDEHRREEERGF